MESSVSVSGRISDPELWPCDGCGVRGPSTERVLSASVPGGMRIALGTVRVCPRCYRLDPNVFLFCAWYLMKNGRIVPQLEEWLAKESEPTLDLTQHILKQRGITDKTEEPVEPYKPAKIIVPIGS